MNNLEIIPGYGFGNLKFGITKDKVVEIAGNPDRESSDNDEFGKTLTYHYSGKRFSLYFEEEDNYCLSCIETDHPDLIFFEEKIIGFSIDKLIELIKKHNLGDYEKNVEEEAGVKDDDLEVCISIDSLEINFYFYDNKLISVQTGVLYNDDNEVCWPV
ncbi:MAG: hypothetical protein GY714_05090 [Desulfobacterales bacterium]|nr:hypothetical protein [Desulfobacterales bacterium]MCP4160282.1 hypothetical protein [Deltaproteobacteria bacterium]